VLQALGANVASPTVGARSTHTHEEHPAMSFTRPLAAALAIAALAVPAAQAQPTDMHASVAQAAAKAQQKQDLRSADTRDAAVSARKQDLRHLQAGGSYTPGSTPAVSGQAVNARGATAVDSASQRPLPGPPTWPVNPQPIKPAPVVHTSDSGGLDWTTIGLGIAGSLLLVAGVAGVARHRRRLGRAPIAA
jgi:hypothetical protein